jgi:hypothetical protein
MEPDKKIKIDYILDFYKIQSNSLKLSVKNVKKLKKLKKIKIASSSKKLKSK